MSDTTLATTVAPLEPLVRAASGAPSAAGLSAQPAIAGFMLGLWVRLGMVGMLVIGGSLAALLHGNASIGEALIGLAAGCLLTVSAWRLTRSALREADDGST